MRDFLTAARTRLRAFLRSNRGNVAMMFGLSLVPLTIAGGVGLDYARSALVKSQMADALDAAALAVGSTKGLTQDTAQALAQKYFNANYSGDTSNGAPTISVAANGYNSNGSFTVTASYNLPTTLLKVVGQQTVPITTSTTVVWGQSKLWVSLVLDNSGSMSGGDSSGTKMDALKNASSQLLTILQNAASNAGDVQVSIVPFVNVINLGTSYVNSAALDWTDWEAPPPNVSLSSSLGPNGNCPFTYLSGRNNTITTQSPYGFKCTTGSSNGSSATQTIPSSGLICPGIDSGDYNTAHRDRYYNGCWTSTPTTTTTSSQSTGNTTTTTICSNNSKCTVAKQCGGYPTSSTTTSGNTSTTTTTTCTCNSQSKPDCTTTATPVTTTTTTTTGAPYTHTWTVNAHSTWSGCIMDRDKTYDYDVKNTDPTTSGAGIPTTNPTTCPAATVTTLNYNWTSLSSQIQNMSPGGSTNQAIGVAQGWQTLTNTAPYNPGSLPSETARYIIILSDGLNTQDRWWGDGSSEGTTEDGYIDAREKKACDNAKADGVIIYSIYLNIGGDADSAPLSYCATDSTKYFELTTTSAVVTTFNQIAQQITAVRISK